MNYELPARNASQSAAGGRTIFLGGTFDGLHLGHQAVLRAAFKAGDSVTIGLTSDKFVSRFKFPLSSLKIENFKLKINSYTHRKQILESWLDQHRLQHRSAILPIDDPYEPASSADYDALIVTQDNIERGREINARRISRSLKPVKLIAVPIIPAEDGLPISSTRLRNGEVDATGRLIMPESLRSLLHKPLGKVLASWQSIQNSLRSLSPLSGVSNLVVSVGDMATQTLLNAGRTPDLSIIDQHLRRQPVDTLKSFGDPNSYTLHRLTSGPGYISSAALNLVKSLLQGETLQKFAGSHPANSLSLRRVPSSPAQPGEVGGPGSAGGRSNLPVVILVTGEEDLLTLPAVLYAPTGSTVYYGQPPHAGKMSGLVEVKVEEKSRSRALILLQQFHGFTATTT